MTSHVKEFFVCFLDFVKVAKDVLGSRNGEIFADVHKTQSFSCYQETIWQGVRVMSFLFKDSANGILYCNGVSIYIQNAIMVIIRSLLSTHVKYLAFMKRATFKRTC